MREYAHVQWIRRERINGKHKGDVPANTTPTHKMKRPRSSKKK
jgi:hypothetical protein